MSTSRTSAWSVVLLCGHAIEELVGDGVQYLACPRVGVYVPTTFRGVSGYASRRLAGLPLLSYTTWASSSVNSSHLSESRMESAAGFKTSPSGTGILVVYFECIALSAGRGRNSQEAVSVSQRGKRQAVTSRVEYREGASIGGAAARLTNRYRLSNITSRRDVCSQRRKRGCAKSFHSHTYTLVAAMYLAERIVISRRRIYIAVVPLIAKCTNPLTHHRYCC